MNLGIDQKKSNKILGIKNELEIKDHDIYETRLQLEQIILDVVTDDYKKTVFINRAKKYYEDDYLDFDKAYLLLQNEINCIGEEFYRKVLLRELDNFKFENNKKTCAIENKTETELNEMLKKIEKELSKKKRENL